MSDPSTPAKRTRANLRDVARVAQVSVATVSRVLNNSDSVTAETRDRVTQAINDLRFVPSAAARALNSGRTRTIGAVVPTLDHAIYAKYLAGLEDGLSARGQSLLVSVTGGDPQVEVTKAKALLNLGVEGLIISGKRHDSALDRLVERMGVPVLITSFYDEAAIYPTIGYDNAAIAGEALSFLQGLGHRRITVIHGDPALNDRVEARLEGLTANLAAGPAPDTELSTISVDLSVAGGVAGARQVLKSETLPTAILCLSDVQALGVLFEMQRQGVRIPQDLSLMGFDNLEWAANSAPALTSIDLPAAAMGHAAAQAICDWADGGPAAQCQELTGELIVRGSTAAPRAS